MSEPACPHVRIALVGDCDPDIAAHRAIPRALIAAAEACARSRLERDTTSEVPR